MKSYSLLTILFLAAIAALVANTVRLSLDMDKTRRDRWRDRSRVELLQVQLMDRVLVNQDGRQLDILLDNSKEWLAPLIEMINDDAKLSSLLRRVSFDSNDPNVYLIYCNPVNDDPVPYEVFTLTFSGDKCTDISRRALCPW